jgi:hypothetical protein
MRTILKCLFVCLLTLALIESVLRFVDPLGAHRYYHDLSILHTMLIRTPDGYGLVAGDYTYSNWSARILPDGTRHVPDSAVSDCTIAFLGDSVTFGQGVDDSATFVNVVAQQVEARIINTGTPGYGSRNVLRRYQGMKASGFVYLVFTNDAELPYQPLNDVPLVWQGYHRLAIESYIELSKRGSRQQEWRRFDSDLRTLNARGDVLFVAFEDAKLWYQGVQRIVPDVRLIALYRDVISYADPHADERGNQFIAAQMLPHVAAWIEERC